MYCGKAHEVLKMRKHARYLANSLLDLHIRPEAHHCYSEYSLTCCGLRLWRRHHGLKRGAERTLEKRTYQNQRNTT
jgi:hypothetical protein